MNTNYPRQNQNARCRLMMMLVVAACLPFTAHLGAPERLDPMAATVDRWFTMIEESFIGLAEAMPAEKYGFKPMDGEFKEARTFREQVKHVACANFGFFNEIEKKEPPIVPTAGPVRPRQRPSSWPTCGSHLNMRKKCSGR
jgi:hypothetical protein